MATDPIPNDPEIITSFLDGQTVVPVTEATPLPVEFSPDIQVVTAYLAPDNTTPIPVSAATPQPVALPEGPQATSLPTLLPQAWVSGVMDLRTYSGVTVQVSGLSGGDTIQVSESYDGTNANVQSWVKNDFTVGSAIASDGNYTFAGGGYMSFAKTGSASTPALTIAGSN